MRMADPCESCSAMPGRGDQVERARPEPVRRAGQGADRADLHGVAGEVRRERATRGVLGGGAQRGLADEPEHVRVERADLLVGAALLQVDEHVAGDLLGEPGAALAQDAALPVQQDLRRDGDRLGERALDVDEPGAGAAVAHRLVLQRALAALVAHRAVERVVDEQQLHDAVLGLVGLRRRVLRLDLHARRGLEGAAGLGLGHLGQGAVAAGCPDLDQALAARAGRGEQGVVAEARDLDAQLLGGADDQGALGHGGLDAVDGEGDQLALGLRRARPARPGRGTSSARRTGSSCVHPSELVLRRVGEQAAVAPAGTARPRACASRPRTPSGSTARPT